MHFCVPFSALALPPRSTVVQEKPRRISSVPLREDSVSLWDYVAAGCVLAKWAVVDLSICAAAQVLPQKPREWAVHRAFTNNGPLFMKLGQFLSTRPGDFSKETAKTLSVLQSCAPAAHQIDVLQMFKEETGVSLPPDAVKEKIGGGCISQVYRVHLRGKDYAVKVVHPHTRKSLVSGLGIIKAVAWVFGAARFAEQFHHMMEQQLDLRREKDNTETLRRGFRWYRSVFEEPSAQNRIWSHFQPCAFIFPKPVVATKSLLVTEYWAGEPIDSRHPEALLILFMRMVFKNKYVHTDLHPGNLRRVPSAQVPTMIVYDTGLAETLTARQRQNLVDLSKEVLLGNKDRALSLLVDRNPRNRHTLREKEQFVADGARAWNAIEARGGGYIQGCLQMYSVAQRHRVVLDECYTNLILPLFYTQKIARVRTQHVAWPKVFLHSGVFREYLKLLLTWEYRDLCTRACHLWLGLRSLL